MITKVNNYLSKYSIFIFAIISLLMVFNHVPFWDETHAYLISRLNLNEIFYLTRIEGHPFLWFLVLKPFSLVNLYPYSMWILNWLFCLGAIIVLWKKAPFSPIIKFLITFSTPFVYYFAPIARCYSIGILFLFLICAYYKKRFKNPYLFSFLIVACANTSVLAMIGAFFIGLLYLFDLILKLKNKTFEIKKLYKIISIFIACTILLLLQFTNLKQTEVNDISITWSAISNFALIPKANKFLPFCLHLISSVAFYYFSFVTFKKTKRGFFFIAFTYLTLTYIFLFIYSGSFWNHYFYFIYFIVFFWIFGKKILTTKFAKFLFTGILILFLFPKAIFESGKMDLIYASKSKVIAKEIIENKTLKNSKLYSLDWWSDIAPGALVYLKKENIEIYDLHNRKRNSFVSIKNIFNMKNETINFDNFVENIDKNSYLLLTNDLLQLKYSSLSAIPKKDGSYIFKTNKKEYYLKLLSHSKNSNLKVYKIIQL